MAMRMTDKQRALAARVASDSFRAGVQLSGTFPLRTPLEQREELKTNPLDWKAWFKRDDITQEQLDELTEIFHESYEKAYADYMFVANTPQSKAQKDQEDKDIADFKSAMSTLLQGSGNGWETVDVDELTRRLFNE